MWPPAKGFGAFEAVALQWLQLNDADPVKLHHWQPNDAALIFDRLGMVVAFAGLTGLAAANRVSARAGRLLGLAVLLLKAEFTIPQIFLFVGLANAVVAFYIFMLVPEYLLRFIAFIASRCVYRFKITGDENIPTQGAAVLTCNHGSFIDPVLLMAASPRPIYFVMDHRIFKMPVLGWLFKLAKTIPIAPRAEDPVAYEAAFETAARVLRNGDLLAIFPEGGITKDGTLQPFKGGIMKILENARRDGLDVPVVPMALTNLWGSFFSRVESGTALVKPFRRGIYSRVGLIAGPALPPSSVRPEVLQARVAALMAQG
jgi:1-acyl-sn-glycerol-3-phosphate acyltransferase